MKNHYDNRTINPKIAKAINAANELLDYQSGMMQELAEKDDFKFNSGTGGGIVYRIRSFNQEVPVFTYRPWNPFTAALGYSQRGNIYLNKTKIDSLEFSDLVGLLCHEILHTIGFSHGNNYKTEEKCLYSVNYFVSENIKKWM